MRLFIAAGFDDGIKDKICSVRDRLGAAALKGHVTSRDNLHLTLAFLGELPPSRIPAIKKAMENASGPAFDITLSGTGRFSRREGDIWWVGVKMSRELKELQDRLSFELTAAGFSLEDREYRPHLTIARGVALPDGFDKSSLDMPPAVQRTEAVFLMKSERIKGVLTYTPVLSVQLDK
jgi:2'-5' RNA ligase